jgi:hypothetical protein
MSMVLVLAAVGEAVTGLLLVLVPGGVAGVLLGTDLTGSGIVVARVAGLALIALAVACWPGRGLLGMLVYGVLLTLYLAWLGLTQAAVGPLLWPAVMLHAVLSAVLAVQFSKEARSGRME